MRGRDDGTVIPLLVLGFLLAGTLLTASVAGSAALVAHRRLAADCDGAALAGATALDRSALTAANPARAGEGPARAGNPYGTGGLPIDGVAARRAVVAYLEAAAPGTAVETETDGRTVSVRCRRTAPVPFGAIIARPHGIPETATARARTVLRPST